MSELLEKYEGLYREIKNHPERILRFSLVNLTKEYLKHLEELVERRFDKAGEFLCFQAYLAYLKSKYLLPKEESKEEEKEPLSPPSFKELKQNIFKNPLENWPVLGEEIFVSPGMESPPPEIEVSLEALLKSLLEVWDRLHPPTIEIKRLEPLFQKMLSWVLHQLQTKKKLSYQDLSSEFQEKIEKIALFLALLDLSFRQICLLIQNLPWEDIEVLPKN